MDSSNASGSNNGSSTADIFIEIRNASKTYQSNDGPVHALDPVNFTIERGKFLSIVGPSGCGKSTLLGLTSGLTKPTSGTVIIDGTEVTQPRTNVGIVFQQPILLEWRTALENVMLQFEMRGLKAPDQQAEAMQQLKAVGLQGFENKYPRELSGGMRQRVSIARGLVHKPPLLMMDEPFSAVDALTRDQLVSDLQDVWLRRGDDLTVLFITHHIEEAVFLSDRVLVMTPRPGRIAEIIPIDLPRPRSIFEMEDERFLSYVRRIREIFLEHGVFRDSPVDAGESEAITGGAR